MPLTRAQQDQILNYCRQHMNLTAMLLGASSSQKAVGGNIAALFAEAGVNEIYRKASYSASSCMPVIVKSVLVPSVQPASFGANGIAPGVQLANHTEPKLLEDFRVWYTANLHRRPNQVVMASERDCCPNCVKYTVSYMTEMAGANAFTFYVAEFQSNRVRAGSEF